MKLQTSRDEQELLSINWDITLGDLSYPAVERTNINASRIPFPEHLISFFQDVQDDAKASSAGFCIILVISLSRKVNSNWKIKRSAKMIMGKEGNLIKGTQTFFCFCKGNIFVFHITQLSWIW